MCETRLSIAALYDEITLGLSDLVFSGALCINKTYRPLSAMTVLEAHQDSVLGVIGP